MEGTDACASSVFPERCAALTYEWRQFRPSSVPVSSGVMPPCHVGHTGSAHDYRRSSDAGRAEHGGAGVSFSEADGPELAGDRPRGVAYVGDLLHVGLPVLVAQTFHRAPHPDGPYRESAAVVDGSRDRNLALDQLLGLPGPSGV